MFFQFKKQIGAGLIEVLVSLLILAVGLLGVLSLQANGLNSNQRAVFVTEAQMIAQDMADRILAFGSADSVVAGNPMITTALYDGISISKGATESSAVCTVASACDSAGIELYDTNEWLRLLNDSSLPRSSAGVSWAAVSRTYTIEVRWDQERAGGAGNVTACNPDSCFTMEVGL